MFKSIPMGLATLALLTSDCTAKRMRVQSDPICNSSGCTQYKHKHQKPDHDVDYPVPSYGPDQDIATTQKNIADLEVKFPESFAQIDSQVEREPLLTWSPTAHKAGHKVDYFVPNFGAKDEDIANTQKNIRELEAKYPSFIQTDSEISREPLATWSPSSKKGGFKKDYFVPNFGP